jgi:hypothetical protein
MYKDCASSNGPGEGAQSGWRVSGAITAPATEMPQINSGNEGEE